MFKYLLSLSPLATVGVAVSLLITYHALQYVRDPLRDVPGPLIARFTRLWYLLEIYRGHYEQTNIKLHNKYGPIVRIAPWEYSVDDVQATKEIYGHSSKFVKVSLK
jgi:hypothetical protein